MGSWSPGIALHKHPKGLFMLSLLRKGTSSAIVMVLIGLLIISFAIWGIGDVFRMGGGNAIAVVGDTKITPQAFTQEYGTMLNRLQQQFGDQFSPSAAREQGLPRQVLQRMVNRELFDTKVREMGVSASDEQVRKFIAGTQAFQNSLGEFDQGLYESALRYNNMTPAQFEAAARSDLAREQLLNTLSRNSPYPKALAARLFAYHGEERTIDVARLRASSISAITPPDETTLTAYYEANQQLFMAPEYRALTALVIRPDDFAVGIAVSEEEMRAYFEENQNTYGTPEKRALEQVVLADRESAEAAHKAIMDGADFTAVATEKTGLTAADLVLGERTQDELADELGDAIAKAAFGLDEGSISAPLEGAFGWHLVKVTKVTPAVSQSFDEARADVEAKLKQEKAVDALYNATNRIEDALAAGSKIEDVAGEIGMKPIVIPAVDAQGRGTDGQRLDALPEINDFLTTAFAMEIGAEPVLREGGEDVYYLVRVDSVTPPAPRPFETVRDSVEKVWLANQRDAKAKEKADALAQALRDGQAMDKAASADTIIQTGLNVGRLQLPQTVAVSPEIREAAFGAAPGTTAVAPAADGDGYVVVLVKDARPGNPDSNPDLFREFEQVMKDQYSNDLLTAFQIHLGRTYGATFNETLLEETVAQVTR